MSTRPESGPSSGCGVSAARKHASSSARALGRSWGRSASARRYRSVRSGATTRVSHGLREPSAVGAPPREPSGRTLRTMRVRRALGLFGIAVLAVACTQAPRTAGPPSQHPPDAITWRTPARAEGGRQHRDGRRRRNGRGIPHRLPAGSGDVEVRQPGLVAGRPVGRLGRARDRRTQVATSRIVTARPDGSEPRRVPRGHRHVLPAMGPDLVAHRLPRELPGQRRDGGGGARPGRRSGRERRSGCGRPFYLSWAPEGLELLVHVGGRDARQARSGRGAPLRSATCRGSSRRRCGSRTGGWCTPPRPRIGRPSSCATGPRRRSSFAYEGSIEFVASPRWRADRLPGRRRREPPRGRGGRRRIVAIAAR